MTLVLAYQALLYFILIYLYLILMYFILLVSAHLAIANNIVRSTANKLAEIGTKVFN